MHEFATSSHNLLDWPFPKLHNDSSDSRSRGGGTPPLRLLGTPCHWRVMPVVAMEVISNPTTWHRPLPSGVIRMDLVSQFPIDMVKYEYQQAEKSSIDHPVHAKIHPINQLNHGIFCTKGSESISGSGSAAARFTIFHNAHTSPNKKICTTTTSEYFPCFYTLPMAEPIFVALAGASAATTLSVRVLGELPTSRKQQNQQEHRDSGLKMLWKIPNSNGLSSFPYSLMAIL